MMDDVLYNNAKIKKAGLIPVIQTYLADSFNLQAVENFIFFANSKVDVTAMNAAAAPNGPYLIKGVQLTSHLSQITQEMQRYSNAKTALAFSVGANCLVKE